MFTYMHLSIYFFDLIIKYIHCFTNTISMLICKLCIRVCEHWTDKINNKNGQNKLSSSYNTATFLVSNGADVNADNPATDGWTPLHLSCWAGSIYY